MPTDKDRQRGDLLDAFVEAPPPGDPEAGPLSETHRAYLRGKEPDIHPSTERSRRQAIRNGISDSWTDMAVAFESLAPEDRAQLILRREGSRNYYEEYSGDDETLGPPELFWSYVVASDSSDDPVVGTGGFRQSVGLGFLSLYDALVDIGDWTEAQYTALLESLVAGALQDALAKLDRPASVDVDIDIDDVEDIDLSTEIESLEELRLRYAWGAMERAEYWEFLGIDPVSGERTDTGKTQQASDDG